MLEANRGNRPTVVDVCVGTGRGGWARNLALSENGDAMPQAVLPAVREDLSHSVLQAECGIRSSVLAVNWAREYTGQGAQHEPLGGCLVRGQMRLVRGYRRGRDGSGLRTTNPHPLTCHTWTGQLRPLRPGVVGGSRHTDTHTHEPAPGHVHNRIRGAAGSLQGAERIRGAVGAGAADGRAASEVNAS